MNTNPISIFDEYRSGNSFKDSIGNRGIHEQGIINERFFVGDQWYGAKCGNDRPLVRHNIIKRIGDYKMSQILNSPLSVKFCADSYFSGEGGNSISGLSDYSEIERVMEAFDDYRSITAERVGLSSINEKILRKAYIKGSSVLYTYWNAEVPTGFFTSGDAKKRIMGDICCEVLDIDNIVFADPYTEDLQEQPYIIIESYRDGESVLREARLAGAGIDELKKISEGIRNEKIRVFTKLFKEYNASDGYTIKSVKVTENAVVRDVFDTGLRLYPLAVFCWETKNNLIYGESEITYLIPNQIAINRMITANVWAAMSNGMPIMMVNGDTVTDKITNEPGQIIKVYGSNEDVAGAVKYVAPPVFSEEMDKSINLLIENTLTQSGANEVALGDSRADNYSALNKMQEAALMPLKIVRNRFFAFTSDVARIWADFWITQYGNRYLKVKDGKKNRYISFNGNDYKQLVIGARVEVNTDAEYTVREKVNILMSLFEKGVISSRQLLERMPKGAVDNTAELISEIKEEVTVEGV